MPTLTTAEINAKRYLYSDLLLMAEYGQLTDLEIVISDQLSLIQIIDLERATRLLLKKLEAHHAYLNHG